MASSKQYKNVYTILEKVKKGEIQSHYKTSDGLFGKLNFYKKADLIKPYIHYIDEDKLDNIIDSAMNNQAKVKQEYDYFSKNNSFKSIPDDKKPDFQAYQQKIRDNYKKIPEHLKYDIFKMYYHKMNKLEFTERTDSNHTRFRFLEKANNPVGKIMTEGGNLKSSVFTRNMMMYYLMQLTQLEYVDPDAAQDIMNGLNGQSAFDNEAADKALDKMFGSQTSKNALERAMQDAQDTCKMMDDNLSKDIQEQMFDEAYKERGGGEAGKLSPDYMRQIAGRLDNIKMSMSSLKEKLKKLLDKSASYFSSRRITTYDDLFNAESIAGLEDFELLHPKLRKIFAEDLQVKDTKAVGKIDVYVDISGSMSSNCGSQTDDGQSISRISFAKSMLAKMKEMDMLNDVYLFDTRVKKYRNDLVSISMIDCNGGTSIDVAVNNIMRTDKNAIIITDAEDRCRVFTEKAFFIGLEGARFTSFDSEVIKQYSNRGQVVVFDGTKIHKVDQDGVTL
jgi:hypothetical protein